MFLLWLFHVFENTLQVINHWGSKSVSRQLFRKVWLWETETHIPVRGGEGDAAAKVASPPAGWVGRCLAVRHRSLQSSLSPSEVTHHSSHLYACTHPRKTTQVFLWYLEFHQLKNVWEFVFFFFSEYIMPPVLPLALRGVTHLLSGSLWGTRANLCSIPELVRDLPWI